MSELVAVSSVPLSPAEVREATASQLLAHLPAIREWAYETDDISELEQAQVLLKAIKERQRQLGAENAETDRVLIEVMKCVGTLLGPADRGGTGANQYTKSAESECSDSALSQPEKDRRWQARKIAQHWPEIAPVVAAMKRPTINAVMREINRIAPPPEVEGGPYRVWYADPPWNYGNTGMEEYGPAERHYPTMSIAELSKMGERVKAQSTDDAVLFLWVTSPLLDECFAVIKAWGFGYRTSFVWDKVAHNYGHYNSVRHEFLLVCVRGSCTPDVPKLYDSVISIERSDQHSEKPEQFRQIIDELYTWGGRVELFARGEVPDGWADYGDQSASAAQRVRDSNGAE